MRSIILLLAVALAMPVEAQTWNLWIALKDTEVTNDYKALKASKREGGKAFTGTMTERTEKVLDEMKDAAVVERMFKKPRVGGASYTMRSIYLNTKKYGAKAIQTEINELLKAYPTGFFVVGAWSVRRDSDGNGLGDCAPLQQLFPSIKYNIHPGAWRLMPDVVEYDENGTELSRVAATNNSDLRDINLLSGQLPRDFKCANLK